MRKVVIFMAKRGMKLGVTSAVLAGAIAAALVPSLLEYLKM